ncbi:MAG: hypothetical protein WAX44_03350 [Minisyncoccia bacterium]
MKEENKNYMDGSDRGVLHVLCVDTMDIKARVTFNSEVVQGVYVTYWAEDTEVAEKQLDKIFSIFFEEVLKTRGMNENSREKSQIIINNI